MPEFSMANLDKIVTITRDYLRKYILLHDVSGSNSSGAASYFNYKGRLFELHKELIQARAMQTKTLEEVCEDLRKQIVAAMRAGQTLVIDCGKLRVNFGEDLAMIPWADIFNFERFREQEEHCKIVKPDEMYMVGM